MPHEVVAAQDLTRLLGEVRHDLAVGVIKDVEFRFDKLPLSMVHD